MYIDSLYKSMTCVNIKYRKGQCFTTLNGFKLSKNFNSCFKNTCNFKKDLKYLSGSLHASLILLSLHLPSNFDVKFQIHMFI